MKKGVFIMLLTLSLLVAVTAIAADLAFANPVEMASEQNAALPMGTDETKIYVMGGVAGWESGESEAVLSVKSIHNESSAVAIFVIPIFLYYDAIIGGNDRKSWLPIRESREGEFAVWRRSKPAV